MLDTNNIDSEWVINGIILMGVIIGFTVIMIGSFRKYGGKNPNKVNNKSKRQNKF